MASRRFHKVLAGQWLLPGLLGVCIARLWLVPISSSFWVDELETLFVAAHPDDPSLGSARPAFQSIYYWLPRAAHALTGGSEISYRLPSVLAMAIALGLIALLARRLIHPCAGWFAVFACLALPGIDYHAIDARPYALGIMTAAASLFFLVKWLASGRWRDALLFTVFAAMVWRVHLVYWPFYAVMALYAISRLLSGNTPVRWRQWAAVAVAVLLALVPPGRDALAMARDARAHVIVPLPKPHVVLRLLQWPFPLLCGAAAWLFGKWRGWRAPGWRTGWTALVLIVTWWLCQPVLLYLYSRITGNSLYVDRYLSIMLPGLALTATALVACRLPAEKWRLAAFCMALTALALQGHWETATWRHDQSDWRSAALEVNRFTALASGRNTPVIVPSPFVEARPPVWYPAYPLPGFLYSHLEGYPIRGKLYLFPFEGADGLRYAGDLARGAFAGTKRFAIYGGAGNVRFWRQWFSARPEFAGWSNRSLRFGDVGVAEFQKR